MSHSFTSESVAAGHPDKICDQISDAILDQILTQDAHARVAVETIVAKNKVVLAGEVTAAKHIDYAQVARQQIRRLGYNHPEWGFSDTSSIDIYIHKQSPEIAVGVETDGAGDQGMMFGYACHETPELMPLPIMLAHNLVRAVDSAREDRLLPYLRPDGKAQVVVRYENGRPVGVDHVTIAVPHSEDVGNTHVKNDIYAKVVKPVLAKYKFSIDKKHLIVNGTGVWHHPGPASDTGLTGRKIIVDSYGGYARVGGGAFSGKDPSKVDRSGAYAARYIAKNIVAHELADRAEVSVSYYIGGKKPVMVNVETFGTEKTNQKTIHDFATKLIDLSVHGIIEKLDLRRPLYLQTAAYGHFGKEGLPWEEIADLGHTHGST